MKRTKSFALIASTLLCLAAFASSSFAANPLVNPRGMAVDAKGNLWVANKQGGSAGIGNILAFGPAYKQLTNRTIVNAILDPTGVAFDSQGNLWVANSYSYQTGNGYIAEFTNGVFNSVATITNGVVEPSALAIDGLDNIWVLNANNSTPNITVYASTTAYSTPATLVQTITPAPPVNGITVAQANVLSFGSNGNIYVTPAVPALISGAVDTNSYPAYDAVALTTAAGIEYVATSDGSVYAVINASPTKLFQVSFTPAGIAVDSVRGRVYLSSGSSNSIAVYSKTGSLLHTIN